MLRGKLVVHSKSRKVLLLIILLPFLRPVVAQAQKELEVIRKWAQYSDAPNSLYHLMASEAYKHLHQRSVTVSGIRTLSAWQQRQQWVRKTLAEVVGPFPAKTPLQATVTGTVEQPGYRIENIVFQSQPGFFVTSTLFVPNTTGGNKKTPAIVYCSGHSQTGYRSYQKIILNLVQKGFIVFAFDPVGQGERLQYFDTATGKSFFQWPAFEHSYVGAQLFITGASLARYMIWDGIRALDYLVTRQEVDTARIGITGRSGGGTQAAYIAAFDERIKAVAPENYITNFTRLFQSVGPQDAEQNFMYGTRKGLDLPDLLIARAPIPTLMLTTTEDMFPIQGAMETAREVRKVYAAYGKSQHFLMVTDEAPHMSTQKNREAMYAFFQRFLNNPGNAGDEAVQPLPAEVLRVTKTGQVQTALQSETVFSINQRHAVNQAKALQEARKKIPATIPEMLRKAQQLSGYRDPIVATPIMMGRIQRQGYTISKYLLQSSPYLIIPYLLLQPEKSNGKAVVYLHPAGKQAAAGPQQEMEWLAQEGITVLAPDLPGIGEMGPGSFRGDTYIDSISYNTWFAAVLTGTSITGIHASAIVQLSRLLQEDLHIKEVYGLAHRQLSPALLHAAAFDTSIRKVALLQPYASYRSIVMSARYDPAFLYSTVPNSLASYDLPDLAASLAPRQLLMINVTDGNGSRPDQSSPEDDLSVIRNAYQQKQTGAHLQIITDAVATTFKQHLKNWIGQ